MWGYSALLWGYKNKLKQGDAMNPPRTGRPTNDPKTVSVRIRLSESDQMKLEYCSGTTGKTKAEIIREGIDNVYNELRKQKQ